MNSERVQGQAFQKLLNEYFPRDAVQVLEDVRVAQHQARPASDADGASLVSIGFGVTR